MACGRTPRHTRRMHLILKIAGVALPLWLIWCALIVSSAPAVPGAGAQIVFVVSAIAAFVGCCWAGWNVLPVRAGRTWRVLANLASGTLLFLAVSLVGHFIGQAVAQYGA